jgi:hypothetical protein
MMRVIGSTKCYIMTNILSLSSKIGRRTLLQKKILKLFRLGLNWDRNFYINERISSLLINVLVEGLVDNYILIDSGGFSGPKEAYRLLELLVDFGADLSQPDSRRRNCSDLLSYIYPHAKRIIELYRKNRCW